MLRVYNYHKIRLDREEVRIHMARSKGTGRGWHGNSAAHAEAGRKGGQARGRNRKKQGQDKMVMSE